MPFYSTSACEKDLITSLHLQEYKKFINDNRELIKENVLKPFLFHQTPSDWESLDIYEEKLMKNPAKALGMVSWGQSVGIVPKEKFYIDSPHFIVYKLQSITGGLYFSIQSGKIPISDNENMSKYSIDLVQKFTPIEYLPSLDDISAKVAFHSISFLIPNFPILEPGEILEVREKIRDDLAYFKNEIKNIVNESNVITYEKIDSIFLKRIKPQFDDLKLKIKSLSGDLFRKITREVFWGGTTTTLLSHFFSLPIEAQIAVPASFIGKILLDVHENISKRSNLTKESKNRWLVFLLKMEKLKS